MTRKIAIIIERADTALGGAERSVSELTGALSAQDFEVHILAAKGNSQAKNVHILCEDTSGKRTGFGVFGRALIKYLSQNHYDIVHSVLPFDFADIYQPRGGTYAESIARNIATYENGIVRMFKSIFAFANFKRTILLNAERKLAQKTDGPRIIAISQYVAGQFQQHYGTNPSRITVIPNGIEIGLPPEKSETDNLRRNIFALLNIKETDKPVLFLFAGNDFRRKGLGCLIKALRLLLSDNPSSPAYLVVAGHRGISSYRKLAVKLNVAGRIAFLGKLGNIHSALAVTDVAVLPTFQDACSRFILEALAAGKPVITTRYNGAADFYTDNRHGRVIERPEDIAEIADTLVYFTNPANIQKASQAILEDNIKQQVSITRVAGQLKAVYDDILKTRGR
jgi:UDP-glucose:(heptosyl)LPS alpha-1,3-glucosyltransferase